MCSIDGEEVKEDEAGVDDDWNLLILLIVEWSQGWTKLFDGSQSSRLLRILDAQSQLWSTIVSTKNRYIEVSKI